MSPHRVGFLRRFGLETGIHFAHFDLESGMVFEGFTGVYERIYRFNSKRVRKKEKYGMRIRNGFEEFQSLLLRGENHSTKSDEIQASHGFH